jgi:hypothetical protein
MQMNLFDRRTALAWRELVETYQQVSLRTTVSLLQWPFYVAHLMGRKS